MRVPGLGSLQHESLASRGRSSSHQIGGGEGRGVMTKEWEGEEGRMAPSCFPLPLVAPPWVAENHTLDKWRDSLSLALCAIPSPGHRNSATMLWVKSGESLEIPLPTPQCWALIATV